MNDVLVEMNRRWYAESDHGRAGGIYGSPIINQDGNVLYRPTMSRTDCGAPPASEGQVDLGECKDGNGVWHFRKHRGWSLLLE